MPSKKQARSHIIERELLQTIILHSFYNSILARHNCYFIGVLHLGGNDVFLVQGQMKDNFSQKYSQHLKIVDFQQYPNYLIFFLWEINYPIC